MCGITGIVYNNALADTSDIKKMSDAIAHRGPDGEGFIAINTKSMRVTELGGPKTPVALPSLEGFGAGADVYLAHRRLSIIDLTAAGHQPMSNRRKDTWISFNGEIYNYKALRNKLSEFEFKSNTDTEVLLYAYQKWGIHCLDRFNGMWAFVIYDAKKKILFGARDRFGVKPLYYTQNADFFAFNSEIKGLLAMERMGRKINSDAAAAFLRYGFESFDGETFFDEIFELEPSRYFIYDLEKKELVIKRYYELPFNNNWGKFDNKKCDEFVEGTRERIVKAVDLRLNADVTAGSCLSGGMDSSAIVCTINKLLKGKSYDSIGVRQGVVTACYENSPIDESKWAQIAADAADADWHRVFPKREDLLADLNDLVFTQDVPFGSTSIYAQYRVMKTAREAGITVMLDGQGGDELFTGYTPYYIAYYKDAQNNKDFDLLAEEQKHIKNTPLGNVNIKRLIQKSELKSFMKKHIPQNAINILRRMHHQPEAKYVLMNGKTYKKPIGYTTINQMLYTLMSYTSLPGLLKYEDRNSMRFSIESRTPFADDIGLIEYVFAIPGVFKIHDGWSKYLLRQAMNQVIPDKILKRTDKIGFATPEYDWLGQIKPYVFDGLNSDINAILDTDKMKKNWEKIFSMQSKTGITNIWRYINFILWFKIFKAAV
jgi:asparagine synthase (glutamine-hydrolysing)